jgi:hypothetical protein
VHQGGATIDVNSPMLVGLGRFVTLLASLSVPVFTCHLSVPHPNAAEADTSSTAAPKIARHIIIPRSGYFREPDGVTGKPNYSGSIGAPRSEVPAAPLLIILLPLVRLGRRVG